MKNILKFVLGLLIVTPSVHGVCLLNLTQPTSLTSICQDTQGNIQFTDANLGPVTLSSLSQSSGSSFPFGITASSGVFGSATSTGFGNNSYLTVSSSGSSKAITVNSNGTPSGGYQNQVGAVTINGPSSGFPGTYLVVQDSATDTQLGTGMIEVWSNNPLHNDPKLWFHVAGHDSSPEIRDDAQAPNWEMINLSTDNAHGLGKWEPAAVAYQGVNLQINSRAYDNSTFETVADWSPLSMGGGLNLYTTSVLNDSAVISSSSTAPVRWFTLNAHQVGLRGPSNTAASWDFQLPSTFSNGGQVLYQATSGSPRNWEFTTGGVVGNSLHFTSTSTAPVWGTAQLTSQTKAQIAALVPSAVGQMYYCSDCTTLRTCVSTGTVVGSFSSPVSATTACN